MRQPGFIGRSVIVAALAFAVGGASLTLSAFAEPTVDIKDSSGSAASSTPSPTFKPLDQRLRGLVKPVKQVTLTAPLEGIVKQILVKQGQRVKLGDPLVRLDDELQVTTVEMAKLKSEDRTDLRKAELQRDEAQVQLDQMEELLKLNAAKEWEVRKLRVQRDALIAAVDAANYQITLAKVNLELERKKLERYKLVAPFSGVILRIPVEEGSTVNSNDQVISVAQLDTLNAELFLPDSLYGKLEIGKEYRLAAEAPVDRELVGKLTVAEPVFDTASHTFRCVLEIQNVGEKLPAGFNARLVWPQP